MEMRFDTREMQQSNIQLRSDKFMMQFYCHSLNKQPIWNWNYIIGILYYYFYYLSEVYNYDSKYDQIKHNLNMKSLSSLNPQINLVFFSKHCRWLIISEYIGLKSNMDRLKLWKEGREGAFVPKNKWNWIKIDKLVRIGAREEQAR